MAYVLVALLVVISALVLLQLGVLTLLEREKNGRKTAEAERDSWMRECRQIRKELAEKWKNLLEVEKARDALSAQLAQERLDRAKDKSELKDEHSKRMKFEEATLAAAKAADKSFRQQLEQAQAAIAYRDLTLSQIRELVELGPVEKAKTAS